MSKTIFITGASRGFGKLWTEAFLKKGYKVAATVRNTTSLDELKQQYSDTLLPLQLDVTDRKDVFSTVAKAKDFLGKIDVVINNAGYGLFGAIEETSEAEARGQIETNVFGLLWVTQAVLPILREQKHGHIIQISSFLGLTTLPLLGLYNASKFAVEGLSETLATEVAPFGIKVTLIEPNGFATDWAGASASQTQPIDAYEPVRKAFTEAGANPDIWGNPEAAVEPILNIIEDSNPPLRLLLGKIAYQTMAQVYPQRIAEIDKWKEVSVKAHGK